MYPVNIEWKFIKFYGYEGHWALLTLVIGFFYQRYNSLKNGYSEDWFISAYSYSILLGFIFARLFHFLFWDTQLFLQDPLIIFKPSGGFAILGGTIGTGLGGYLYCKRTGKDFFHWCDSLMSPIAICLAISRISCFLNGDAYGTPTNSFLGVVFSEDSIDWTSEWKLLHRQYALLPDPLAFLSQHFRQYLNLADIPLPKSLSHLRAEGISNLAELTRFYPPNVSGDYLTVLKSKGLFPFPVIYPPVHPTQLYESFIMFLAFFIIFKLEKITLAKRKLFFIFWVLYGLNRLVIEIFRGDRNVVFFNFTYAQLISMGLIIFGILGIVYIFHSEKKIIKQNS
ncbi:MAG: prolipoprotein diacylglyceryl transferase [Leptospiraceae bacterium]|nr:prolipoprotein diacylglyceryl transferase [Leptospiraceae bacterium]